MATLDLDPLHADFGARIHDVDVTGELSAELVEAIRDAIDTYSFICFQNQNMDDEAQIRFTRLLGDLEPNHLIYGETRKIVYLGTIGNVIDDKTK